MYDMQLNIESISILETASIREAIVSINHGGCGIALVVDEEHHLIGTVTDGDVRRAMLALLDLGTPIRKILVLKSDSQYAKPITAILGTKREELLGLMRQHVLRQIPILDDNGCVVDLVMLNDLVPLDELNLQAVIMAGGLGTRLRPLTEDLPKPMLPVDGKPLIERMIGQLRQVGIRRINLMTYYKSEKIVEHFGDGHAFGVELNYVDEERPLGTGGALGLMPHPNGPVLVINGDILTQVDFHAMLDFHQENHSDMTIGVRRYEMQVPYGVIECEGVRVRRLQEKPQVGFLVNAGIYLLEPSVYQFIPQNSNFNMTDLIQWLLDAGRTVVSFPIHEYWLDIGQHEDYTQAQGDAKNGRFRE